jgi:hypothetical protein
MKNSKKLDLLNSQYDSETLTSAKKVVEVCGSVSVSDLKTILYVAGKIAEINSKLV